MGITTAVFTLIAGITSLVGGDLMAIDIQAPFYIVSVAAIIGVGVILVAWRQPEIKRLTQLA